MLTHKQCKKAVSFYIDHWKTIPFKDVKEFKNSWGKPEEMMKNGMKARSQLDKSYFDFVDLNGKVFAMIFKKDSVIAFGDGMVYFYTEDVLEFNPPIRK